jgi:tRNA pseudouridine55 synthase
LVPAGVLLRAKPAGVTSHDVVADVRRSLPRGTKVGHAGTLDPFATGLLLVLVGRATRAQRFLMGLPKTYRAVARLGWVSDTGDRDGELVETGRVPERLSISVGEQLQRPPAYSAVKVGGRRAYQLARAGEAVETSARPVRVHRAELLWAEGDRAAFEIECSAGTYVRTLIADLGDAYCDELERTAIGPFRLEDADPERIVPLAEALAFLPERVLDEQEAKAVRHGRRVAGAALAAGMHGEVGAALASGPGGGADTARAGECEPLPVRLTAGGELLAIAEPRGDELQPVVVFAPA